MRWEGSLLLILREFGKKKLLLFYLVFIFIPICALIYLYYSQSTTIIENERKESMLQTLKQAEINVSYRLNSIAHISDLLVAHPSLYSYHIQERSAHLTYQHILKIRELKQIFDNAASSQNVFKIRLYLDPQIPFSREGIQFFSLLDIQDQDWYESVIDANGAIFWIHPYDQTYLDGPSARIISAARILRHPNDYREILGMLFIDIRESDAFEILSNVYLSEQQKVFVIDEAGIPFSDHTLSQESKLLQQLSLQSEGYTEGEHSLLMYAEIPSTKWKIVSEIPYSQLYGSNVTLNKISSITLVLTSVILFILVTAFVFVLIVENLNRRIREMVISIRKEGLERLEDDLLSGQSNIHLLGGSIAKMIQIVKLRTEESLKAKMQEKEALLQALQAQINPHFLYNTLEAVNWMAIRRNAPDISFMITALAKYFRMSLKQGQDIVSVDDEIKLVKVYLDIQLVRFNHQFEVSFEIEENILHNQIPKLTLQPIVENALLHGISEDKSKQGKITIKASIHGEKLIIEIHDNGIGMSKEQLDRLFQVPAEHHRQGGYGLYNVRERLKLFSGQAKVMEVLSEVGQGTIVRLSIPRVEKE